jgi:hypothetical protein
MASKVSWYTGLERRFVALAAQNRWEKGSGKYHKQRKEFFGIETTKSFGRMFGYHEEQLQGWRRLCNTIGVQDAMKLKSVRKCQKVRKRRVLLIFAKF